MGMQLSSYQPPFTWQENILLFDSIIFTVIVTIIERGITHIKSHLIYLSQGIFIPSFISKVQWVERQILAWSLFFIYV